VPLATIQDSCNRLPQRDDTFDVVTVSQALHWLDDVAICRGACRVLGAGGSFFVVHSAITMDDAHPLSYLFGDRSVLGEKRHRRFVDEVRPLWRRLAGLVDALDAPEVARIDSTQRHGVERLVPAGVALFRQTLAIGPGFARAFLSDRHVDAIGKSASAVHADVDARCAGIDESALDASLDWAVLHFRRQPEAIDLDAAERAAVVVIPRAVAASA
jgi:SAM-dependent methyltransferase